MVDGGTIPLTTVWGGFVVFYKINMSIPENLKGLKQIRFLIQHQEQLAKWVLLLETESFRFPSVISVMWKSEEEKIINFSFGATFSEDSTGRRLNQSSHPTRQEGEFIKHVQALELRQLCRNQSVSPSSVFSAGSTHKNPFDLNANTRRSVTLRKLPQDLELQCSNNVSALLDMLKKICPFNEASGGLYDYEFNDFRKVYGISDVHPILSSDDEYVFWLKNTTGAIYIWSRIDHSMLYIGDNLGEALNNYLFHQDNLCYVMECTHKIVPVNEIDQTPVKYGRTKLIVTEELLKKRDGKSKETKKRNKY
ncbi:hypothetical protein C1645_778524 [Glomus cerebriforme]|uniref:Uncharacterized protein n=1 Tax=Glomus cerebriforme TaxID=658196 RepID=A0A397SL71_9GLOM|nr:hypothetical protein C1645_778524 [Glomus cerebriforme]